MPYGLNTGSSRGLPDLRLHTEHANAVSNYLGTYLLSCLSHNEEESAKVFCRLTDSFLRSFYVNEAEYPVDFLVVTKNDTAWIVIRGTENLMQGLGHLASIISTRNPTFGGWTNPQFDIQAKLLSDNLRANNLYSPSYTKYRIIGHSLGAATGYLLGLYIKHFRPECDVQCLGFGEPKSIAQFSSRRCRFPCPSDCDYDARYSQTFRPRSILPPRCDELCWPHQIAKRCRYGVSSRKMVNIHNARAAWPSRIHRRKREPPARPAKCRA